MTDDGTTTDLRTAQERAQERARNERVSTLLDALVADLAKGIEPDVIAKRHEERKRLEDELDGS